MAKSCVDLPAKGGFSFDLCKRNAMLSDKGLKLPPFRKTGTTIVGLVFQVTSFYYYFFIDNCEAQPSYYFIFWVIAFFFKKIFSQLDWLSYGVRGFFRLVWD
jgi:hypothetical protein